MSRKIIQTSGFENVLSRSTGKFYFTTEEASGSKGQLRQKAVYDLVNTNADQKLFCGGGLIVGSLRMKGKIKKIAGPLIYCLADCSYENQKYSVDLDEFSITLNHDLITSIVDMGDLADEEIDDDRQLTKIAPIFQTVSDGFAKGIKQGRGTEIFQFPASIRRVFEKLREGASEFQFIMESDGFQKNSLTNYFEEGKGLQFFAQSFYFVAPFPNQLSTYEALGRLIQQVR